MNWNKTKKNSLESRRNKLISLSRNWSMKNPLRLNIPLIFLRKESICPISSKSETTRKLKLSNIHWRRCRLKKKSSGDKNFKRKNSTEYKSCKKSRWLNYKHFEWDWKESSMKRSKKGIENSKCTTLLS